MFSLRLRHRFIRFVGRYPALFFTLVGIRKWLGYSRGLAIIGENTELVIEGFFRSANSFATRAFLSAQPRKVVVANRTHVPATIIRAARRHLPTLVLIREPRDVAVSYMMKMPHITASDALREYIAYYTAIQPYRQHFLVASFEEVTTDFGKVIERINRRFNTNFARFCHTRENVRQVFATIERVDRQLTGGDVGKISVPLPEKEQMKEEYRRALQCAELQPLLARAKEIFADFVVTPSPVVYQDLNVGRRQR